MFVRQIAGIQRTAQNPWWNKTTTKAIAIRPVCLSWRTVPIVSSMACFLLSHLILGTLAAADASVLPTPIRIMPVGDSITVGYTNLPGQPYVPFEYGYRADLYTRLVDAGYPSFQFVGSSTEHPTPEPSGVDLAGLNQDYHNGYGGQGISYISSNIASWIRADNPDVILLMIGINDIGQGGTGNPVDAESRLNTLVQTVVTAKPSAHLIVAQTIPYATYTDSIIQYNAYIKNTLVPSYKDQGKLVTTVDQYCNMLTGGAIDPSLYSNGINHPTAVGYDRMAQSWFDGIESLGPITHTPLRPACIHAVSDVNLLSNKAVVASSVYSDSFDPSYATDGTAKDHVFKGTSDEGTDTHMRLVVHGIGSGFNLLRIWQNVEDFNRIPTQVTIRSSAADTTSLNPASFETSIISISSLLFDQAGYVDIEVNAPINTQSLFFGLWRRRFTGTVLWGSNRGSSGIHGGRAGVGNLDVRADRDPDLQLLAPEKQTRLGNKSETTAAVQDASSFTSCSLEITVSRSNAAIASTAIYHPPRTQTAAGTPHNENAW